jgi:hypothetical protein
MLPVGESERSVTSHARIGVSPLWWLGISDGKRDRSYSGGVDKTCCYGAHVRKQEALQG